MADGAGDLHLAAARCLARRDAGGPWAPGESPAALTLDEAYALAATCDRLRQRAGARPRGWKIGFTNRSIWPRYGVHQPIWARVWDDTVTMLDGPEASVSLDRLCQPRIEPEVVFGFAAVPDASMDEDALRRCLAWVAHGVEIVHTHVEGWRFDGPALPVADFGLHGRLVVGPRIPVADWPTLGTDLAALTMRLHCGGREVDLGHGALVLDGPLQALRTWLQAAAEQAPGAPVAVGDVVTTGTLTDAWPVAPGETWSTEPGDARLIGLTIRFTA